MFGLVISEGLWVTLVKDRLITTEPATYFEESGRILIYQDHDGSPLVLDLRGIYFTYIRGSIVVQDSHNLKTSCQFLKCDDLAKNPFEGVADDHSSDDLHLEIASEIF